MIAFATSAEIDSAIVEILADGRHRRSLALATALLRKLLGGLALAGRLHPRSDLWNASEPTNRACQRLKRAGKLEFDRQQGWRVRSGHP